MLGFTDSWGTPNQLVCCFGKGNWKKNGKGPVLKARSKLKHAIQLVNPATFTVPV